MKHLLFLIILVILNFSCEWKNNSENIIAIDTIAIIDSLHSSSNTNIIEHVSKPYFVGDINNDGKGDTAVVIYDRSIRHDGTIEKECINKGCEVVVKFSSNIPELVISQSLDIFIQKAEDLNNDNSNEIVLHSQWFEGWWENIYVWSYKNNKWNEIARTKAFLSDDKDYKNRIVKEDSQFYLVGDGWDDSKGGLTERSIRVKIDK